MPTKKSKPYILNKLDDENGELLIYDQIGESFWEEGITAKTFSRDLRALGKKIKNITVRINSPGGSVWDGLAIYNTLKQHNARVLVLVDGLAASIASVIAMAGDDVQMADSALMMIHNPSSVVAGDSRSMREAADVMDKTKEQLVKAYAAKTGMDSEEIARLLDDETWMTSDEAFEMGFIDGIVEDAPELAACHTQDVPESFHVPASLQARVTNLLTGTSDQLEEDMPKNETQAPAITEPQAATIEQLEALAGADDSFVLQQFKAKATLADAQAVLMQRLTARVDELTKENAELRNAKPEPVAVQPQPQQVAQPEPQPEPKPVQPVNIGVQPVTSSSAPTGGQSDDSGKPWGGDPNAFFNRAFAELVASGLPMQQAIKKAWSDNPGLQEAVTASAT